MRNVYRYFHRRGKLVFFDASDYLCTLVVINPTWFVREISRLLDQLERSTTSIEELRHTLRNKELDRALNRAVTNSTGLVSSNIASSDWLMAALISLDVLIPTGWLVAINRVVYQLLLLYSYIYEIKRQGLCIFMYLIIMSIE